MSQKLELSEGVYALIGGRAPAVSLLINGFAFDIPLEQKPFLLDRGIVVLSGAYDPDLPADFFPAIDVPGGDEEAGEPGPFTIEAGKHACLDLRLVKAARQLVADYNDGDFTPGVKIEFD